MKPLRIVHSEAATDWGGQEQYIYRMMLLMRERGHHLEAICQPEAELTARLRESGFTVHTLPMDGTLNYWRGVAQVRRILKDGRFDVLNTHSRRDALLAGLAGRLAGTPLIVRTRHLAKRPRSLLSYTRIPHCVVTPSEFVRQSLIERGVAPNKVAVVYPVVSLQIPEQDSTLRAELGLDEQAVIVGCVAAMRPRKGHATLFQAMQPLLRERPNVHLVFIGDGEPVFQQLQQSIEQAGLQQQVHLLGRRGDVPNLLKGLDVFALATEQEASGTVFVEAAMAGLPVVGTRVDGVPEMLSENVTGLLVPVGDAQVLMQALRKLLDDPALRREMGSAGLRLILEQGKFTPEGMVERVEACYGRWLSERGAGKPA
ncbi:glycosyltransferase family 4 protein [Pusillimonas sp. CC-YST705]|uniref:Glycosyltransferase family 4 protein n=1 Tax=Mesopusillimonas faecipullorum TaxID=2755040 RepID=A0ABS8CFL0_9BURK|nr:glycosyltransferase family 4 protein [Mesopusillimonas faecipullorum]MCB5364837.1 glycosyltransferase family 4 protein [Mesopusillimonas faecipullorum]